jgi:hypothetical protein
MAFTTDCIVIGADAAGVTNPASTWLIGLSYLP